MASRRHGDHCSSLVRSDEPGTSRDPREFGGQRHQNPLRQRGRSLFTPSKERGSGNVGITYIELPPKFDSESFNTSGTSSHSCRAKPRNLHSPRVPCYTRLISTCRSTCRMNMYMALVAFVVIRVIRGVVCLTYHLFRGGSPEAEPAVCRKKTDMPRYKFHANVEASIPSAPGTQLMSRTNYEAVADFAGHWLHRAQVSLLTGKIGQIKLGHIRRCGPGAGLVRAWRGFEDRSRGAGLALRNLLMAGVRTECTQLHSRQESSPVRSKKRLAPWPTP